MAEWRALGYVPDSDDDEDETQQTVEPIFPENLEDIDEIKDDYARDIPDGQCTSAHRLDCGKEQATAKEPSGVSIQKEESIQNEEAAIQDKGTRSELGHHLSALGPELSKPPLLIWDIDNVGGVDELQQDHEATPLVRLPAELSPYSQHAFVTHSITPPRQDEEANIQDPETRSEIGQHPDALGPELSKLPLLIWDIDNVHGIDEFQQDHETTSPIRLSAELFPSSEDNVVAPPTTPSRPRTRGSLPSSPLTELTSSPPAVRHSPRLESPTKFGQAVGPPHAHAASPPGLLEPSNQILHSAHQGNSPLDGAYNGNIRTRNLRHRNPIQLHPYAIENEMYRQILRARGVKPLRLAPVHDSLGGPVRQGSQQGESDAEDTQNRNMDMSSHHLRSSSPSFHRPLSSSSPPANDSSQSEEDLPEFAVVIQCRQSHPTQPNTHTSEKQRPRSTTKSKWRRPLVVSPIHNGLENTVHGPLLGRQPVADVDDDCPSLPVSVTSSPPNRVDFSDDEEEFPDVNVLLRRQSYFAAGAAKRRKLTHTPSKGGRRLSDQGRTLKGPQTPPTSDNLLDVPSPSRPGAARLEFNSPHVFRGFSASPEASLVKLPTPVTSSEPNFFSSTVRLSKVLSQTIVLSDSSSDENGDLTDSRIIISEDEADSDSEAAEAEAHPQAYFPKSTQRRFTQARPQHTKRRKVQTSLDNVVRRKPMSSLHPHNRLKTRRHPQYNKENHYAPKKIQKPGQSRITDDSRPALLESLEEHDDRAHPQAALQRHVLKAIRDPNLSPGPNILLDRFLGGHQRFIESVPTDPKARRRRKRHNMTKPTPGDYRENRREENQTERIELEPSEFEQRAPKRPIQAQEPPDTQQKGQILHGLGPFGTEYTQNFDILPLPIGTYLHSSTFIGSGIFHQSLQLDKHEILDALRGYSLLTIAQTAFKWGPWNDVVSTQLGDVFHSISEHLQSHSISNYQKSLSLLTDVVQYLSDHLSYLDPVDRVSSLQRFKSLLLDLVAELDAQTAALCLHQDLRLRFFTILLVYSNQLHKISTHQLVPEVVKVEINSHQLNIADRVLHLALNVGFETLSACLRNGKSCEFGIKDNPHSIEAVIIAHHVLRESESSLSVFWGIVWNVIIAQSSHDIIEFRVLERSWQRVFTILPFLSFDAQGVMEPGHRFRVSNDGWPAVRQLVSCVLELHLENPSGQGATFNAYCRALFGRCLHLVNAWGWRRCESAISTMFAFFARNNLAHLSNEDSHGSPRYLENLSSRPDLLPSSEDRCFHIFLKLIGTGLSHMQGIYTPTKVRDIVWRLMPNHGRLHLKDETLSQRDVDALRNHHDLLCTLYWASPPAVRPRLSAIRNLVHLESAHREAYRIHIRAWSNLVRFQLSTDEEISALKPFAEWHDDFLVQLLRQHNSARTEAEDQARTWRPDNGPLTDDVLEAIVSKTERQSEVVLSDALASLNSVMHVVKNQEQATSLLTPALVSVFALFDARKSHANATVVHALDIVLTYASQSIAGSNQPIARASNDDSQDYGDWSAFEDVTICKDDDAALEVKNSTVDHLLKSFYEPVKHLLSNAFGADTVPEDTILLKIILVWVAVAHVMVCQGTKSWSDYLSPFAVGSWSSLRRTEQTQKFTPYYLAVLLEKDTGIFREHKHFFLTSWIDCLVERESMIKFQHVFTAAILNAGHDDPLLANLPFCVDLKTGKFDISATDFLARRSLLIASLLSNMREALEDAHCEMSSNLANVRQEYVAMVKHLMNTMKRNYQELGQGSVVKGSYVEFVQRVIEFLQQHTSDFCPVDRFFIDSAGFPLPATDPTYIVGRLRNYALRLHDSRTPKQLAVFLQSVCERAAVDGQQNYLAGQLHTAMSNVVERGSTDKPTLQSFLVKGIIPAYIEVAFGTSIGWLLVSPILQAVRDVFRQLFKSLDGASTSSINAVASILTAFLYAARNATRLLTDHSGLLEQSHILRLLKLVYSSITPLVPIIDYIVRLTSTTVTISAMHPPPPSSTTLLQYIRYFKSFAIFASEILLDYEDPTSPQDDDDDDDEIIPCPPTSSPNIDMQEIRDFTLKELRDSISRNWVIHDGKYYVIRGNTRRDVVPEEFTYTQEKEAVIRAFEEFLAWCGMVMPERKKGKMIRKLEKGNSMMTMGELVF